MVIAFVMCYVCGYLMTKDEKAVAANEEELYEADYGDVSYEYYENGNVVSIIVERKHFVEEELFRYYNK